MNEQNKLLLKGLLKLKVVGHLMAKRYASLNLRVVVGLSGGLRSLLKVSKFVGSTLLGQLSKLREAE